MLNELVVPPADLALLALAGLFAGWRYPALRTRLWVIAGALLYALSTPAGAHYLIWGLQRDPALDPARVRPGSAGAIVVLSAGQQVDPTEPLGGVTVDGRGLERLRLAARLAKPTGLPVLVSGGVLAAGRPTLADQMRVTLERDFGVPVAWVERRSLNTAENAIESAALLRAAKIERVILVTDAWHIPRARQCFEANGIGILAAPVAPAEADTRLGATDFIPDAGALLTSSRAVHEWLGIGWYRVRYGFAFPG